MRNPATAVVAVACVWFSAQATSAGEPRGPEFGNVTYSAIVHPLDADADIDDYVASLAAGDTLALTVGASGKSTLQPSLVLVDPDGVEVDPAPRVAGGGRKLTVKAFAVTKSGRWGVRIGGRSGTEGTYTARFHVTPAKPLRLAKQRLGGADPLTATVAFEAADGSAITLAVKSSGDGAPVRLRSLTAPSGADIAIPAGAVVASRNVVTVKNLPLASGSGTYRLGLGIDSGSAVYSLKLGVVPPKRLAGKVVLARDEPYLSPLAAPIDGTGGQLARIEGLHFDMILPRPKVWIGAEPASVAAVGPAGGYLDIVPPHAPGDTIADVTVQNSDGQATTRPAYFHYVPQGPLEVASLEPATARIAVGTSQPFTVTLTRLAAPPGIDIAITSSTPLGSFPSIVHVPGNSSSATFLLSAGQAVASGKVEATYAGTTLSSDVDVVPPGTVVSVTPNGIAVTENQKQTFTVTLSSGAPTVGVDVALSIPSYIGTGPSSIHIDGGKTTGTFVFTAIGVRAAGTIRATAGGDASADVRVVPPTSLDVSGWTVVQQYSSLSYTIPSGTVLNVGECIVIGKGATATQFQGAWAVTFSNNVHYLNAPSFPDIDGYETVQLKDRNGVSVDGPTIQMAQNGGFIYGRKAGTPAGLYPSWLVYAMSGIQGGLPGTGEQPAPNFPGIYISKFSDSPVGAYDFVEIYLDELP